MTRVAPLVAILALCACSRVDTDTAHEMGPLSWAEAGSLEAAGYALATGEGWLLASSEGGLSRSEDGGAHWTAVPRGDLPPGRASFLGVFSKVSSHREPGF